MASYCTDQGICLRCADFSETSQIATVFTVQHGLVHGIAKGSKRVPTKPGNAPTAFSGPLDLFNAGQLVFILPKQTAASSPGAAGGGGSAGGLAMLTSWQLEDQQRLLRQSLPGLQSALIAAEVTLHLLHPYEVQTALYQELAATLILLSGGRGGGAGGRALVGYVKAVLTAAGYQPHLHACVVCQTPVSVAGTGGGEGGTVGFDPLAGGVVCNDCRSTREAGVTPRRTQSRRTHPTFKTVPATLLLALDRLSPPTVLQVQLPDRPADPVALRQALELLLDQVQSITDRPLRTRWQVPGIFQTSSTAP